MRIRTDDKGNLVITASNRERAEIAEAYRDAGFPRADQYVREALEGVLCFIPEADYPAIGALTSAPIVTDEYLYTNDGTTALPNPERVWWFPDYAVRDEWAALKDRGRVEFQRVA